MNGQRLRPLGVGDIFDEGFDLYKRNFVFLLLTTAVTVVPLDIGLVLLTPRLLPVLFGFLGVTATDGFWLWAVTGLTKALLFLPLFFVAVAPVVAAASARYLDRDASLGAVLTLCVRRGPALLLAALLAGLGLALGLMLCGLPWLAAFTLLLFTLPALLMEGKGPVGALRRSAALGGGYGFRVFGCLLLLGVVLWTISLGLRLPLAFALDSVLNTAPGAGRPAGGGTPGGSQAQAAALISTGLAHLLLVPFLVSVVVALYYDLRIRKEGYDMELLARELGYPDLSAAGPFLPPVQVFIPLRPAPPSRLPRARGGGPRP